MAAKKKAKKKVSKKTVKSKTECGSCGTDCGCGKPVTVYHGLYASMDPETGIFTEANYNNGNLHGEYTEYYDVDAEIIKTRGRYSEGNKEGQWISYSRDGKALKVDRFKHGKKLK
jgi:antitoxin component YwqK of YwqJK toxin-antitoxin module